MRVHKSGDGFFNINQNAMVKFESCFRLVITAVILLAGCQSSEKKIASDLWKPDTDWGHWRLGHRSDLKFLKENKFTVTFGNGALNFESVTREEFNRQIEEARLFNKQYNENGYIVLRYMTNSLGGQTETNMD